MMEVIGGAVINVDTEGDSEFGVVGYHQLAIMNILSIGEIIDRCIYIEIKKYERSLVLQLTSGGPVYVFKRVNNQFICNLSSDVVKNVDNNRNNKYSYKHIGVAMVEERNKLFSRAELSRADEARQLQQRMGYPSAGQLIKQIQHGKIDTRVSATDINSAYIWEIYW